jgi:hypothetical protein
VNRPDPVCEPSSYAGLIGIVLAYFHVAHAADLQASIVSILSPKRAELARFLEWRRRFDTCPRLRLN